MADKIICKNCGNHFKGRYCNLCGEKVYTEHDKKITHFFEEIFHYISHVEGTLFTTIKTIVKKPGLLSADYCNGIRKKYFKPLSFFLLLVFIYLIFPVFEGLNMRLQYYPNQPYYGSYAAQKITAVIEHTGLTKEKVAEKFHAKGEKTSKFLLLSLIPFTALVFYALAFFKRKHLFDHIVFAAEINAVYLFWGFLLLPLLLAVFNWVYKLFAGTYLNIGDAALGIIIYTGMCIYTLRASRRFYGYKWWQSILFTFIFYFAHVFIVYTLYKFLLFIIVINQM